MMVTYDSRTNRVTRKGNRGNPIRHWTVKVNAENVDAEIVFRTKKPTSLEELREDIADVMAEHGYDEIGHFHFVAMAR